LVDALIYKQIEAETPGAIELNRLGNFSRLGFASTRYSTSGAYAAAFQRLLSSLRYDVQHAVFERLHPRGYFLSHERELPAIELMQVVSAGELADDWISATREWRGAVPDDTANRVELWLRLPKKHVLEADLNSRQSQSSNIPDNHEPLPFQ
jgi:hypothetical protein